MNTLANQTRKRLAEKAIAEKSGHIELDDQLEALCEVIGEHLDCITEHVRGHDGSLNRVRENMLHFVTQDALMSATRPGQAAYDALLNRKPTWL